MSCSLRRPDRKSCLGTPRCPHAYFTSRGRLRCLVLMEHGPGRGEEKIEKTPDSRPKRCPKCKKSYPVLGSLWCDNCLMEKYGLRKYPLDDEGMMEYFEVESTMRAIRTLHREYMKLNEQSCLDALR